MLNKYSHQANATRRIIGLYVKLKAVTCLLIDVYFKIYHDFKYLTTPTPEGLSRYFQRMHELLHEMAQAKPTPLIRNDEEILHTYRTGLIRAGLFVEELRACDIINQKPTATSALS